MNTQQPRQLTPAMAVSVAVHAVGTLALLLLFQSSDAGREPDPVAQHQPLRMVWIPDPRPPARGGGARPLERKPTTAASPAVVRPQPDPIAVEPKTIAPEPEPQVVVETTAPSASAPASGDNDSRSASAKDGDGLGPGAGPQTGPGHGGFIYGVGNGVTAPVPLRRPPPAYTAEAMRARLQGVVVLNCVVQPDGTCSDIRVTRSLDALFGLDQQAIASARQWRFRPGVRLGEPVPVHVTLEIAFSIR